MADDGMAARLVQWEAEHERDTAYHEAGHAVILWFFAAGHDINHISIKPHRGSAGRVRPRGMRWDASAIVGLQLDLSDVDAKRIIMFDLGGIAAENRVASERYDGADDWLYWAMINWLDTEMENPLRDIGQARTAAGTQSRTWGRMYHLMRTCARWCDELLDDPRVWRIVEIVAQRLLRRKYIDGSTAWNLMDRTAKAEGIPFPPYLGMSPKWRRRFTMKTSP